MCFRILILFILLITFLESKALIAPLYNSGWEEQDSDTIMDSSLPMPKDFSTKETPQSHIKQVEDSTILHSLDSIKPSDINIESKLLDSIKQYEDSKQDSMESSLLESSGVFLGDLQTNKIIESNEYKIIKVALDSKKDSKEIPISEKVEKQAQEYKKEQELKKQSEKIPQIQDIDYRIHELQKEKYMLSSQVYFKEKEKHDWIANTARSGYYIGGGVLVDFVNTPNRNEGIKAIRVNFTGIAKLGYIRYFNNDIGIKVEGFSLFGENNGRVNYYAGTRFSLLHDVNLFRFTNAFHFGFIMGFGFGAGWLNNVEHIGINLHLGVSFSITKYIRFEIERLILNPLNPLEHPLDFRNNYVVSGSFVF